MQISPFSFKRFFLSIFFMFCILFKKILGYKSHTRKFNLFKLFGVRSSPLPVLPSFWRVGVFGFPP